MPSVGPDPHDLKVKNLVLYQLSWMVISCFSTLLLECSRAFDGSEFISRCNLQPGTVPSSAIRVEWRSNGSVTLEALMQDGITYSQLLVHPSSR
ncbi:hypothetical protein F3Y22_tig00110109pilonHSYRG00204 [Hibiscus syriacus]|uniref:Uncharacterized protein n=1 Tax=Hibiscus syriacus TaxID=106335 RepID=A0A6A3BKK5_HIBSY|nr:hypothetical protein F3Y22_tig00110109pilonHSYRG00204 [Hibiscus syriacus]